MIPDDDLEAGYQASLSGGDDLEAGFSGEHKKRRDIFEIASESTADILARKLGVTDKSKVTIEGMLMLAKHRGIKNPTEYAKEDRDKRIISAMGFDPNMVTVSKSYKPGMVSSRIVREGDAKMRTGQATGGTLGMGLIEGADSIRRNLEVGLAHVKEAFGGDKSDRILSEVLANVDAANYQKSTTDQKTGKGNFGQTLGPIASQLLLARKIPGKNPALAGAVAGLMQPRQITGDKTGGSDFVGGKALDAGLGAGFSMAAEPLVVGGMNKLADSKLGKYLGVKAQEGAYTLEQWKKYLKDKLQGKTPGETVSSMLKGQKETKWKELDQLFGQVGRRARAGNVDTKDIVRTVDNEISKIEREGNLDDPVLNALKEFRDRITQPDVSTGGIKIDPYTGVRTGQGSAKMMRGESEAGTTFQDMMREYKIAGQKMRGAFSKGGAESKQGAMSVPRGNTEREIKNAIKEAARKHDPKATAEWEGLQDRWKNEFKPFIEGDIANLIESGDVGHPNMLLKTMMGDETGDYMRNLSRVPIEGDTRTALQSEFIDKLLNVYNKGVKAPMHASAAETGGPAGVVREIAGGKNNAFVDVAFPEGTGSRKTLEEIAKRAQTADRAGATVQSGAAALAAETGLAPFGLSNTGVPIVGGAVAAHRFLPNYMSRAIYRSMESPALRRLVSNKLNLPPDAPEVQKAIDDLLHRGVASGMSGNYGYAPSEEDM